jgi:polygalacturonase
MNKRRIFLKQAGLSLLVVPVASLAANVNLDKPNSLSRKNIDAKLPAPPSGVSLNIRDFGATGDGKTKETTAIQQCIDRCYVLGGGEIIVPEGNYLTGAIQLHSNTLLRLGKNAIISGSPDLGDYPVMLGR